jgi:hypothetical protein
LDVGKGVKVRVHRQTLTKEVEEEEVDDASTEAASDKKS